MDSVAVTVPLRPPTKKMKKRKELDALAPPHAVSRRSSGKRSSQELLSDSSDDRSEYWNVSSRNGRKCRGRRGHACPGFLKACGAFLACASVLATASLIWLFIDVRQQLSSLRTEMDQVIAGNEGVPDALQKFHSISRDLQNNQTVIFANLTDLKSQINNFTTQLAGIQHDLREVQDWFKAAPEIAKIPKDLNDLSNNVASFGSQIRDLGATVNTLKETNLRVQQNITSIKDIMTELSNNAQKPQLAITNETQNKTDELKAAILLLANNVTSINETLTQRLKWANEDQTKDHKILDGLQDTTQNIKTKVLSLQTECAKLSDQTTLLASVKKLTNEVKDIHTTEQDLGTRLKQLEQSYETIKNSTSTMFSMLSDMQGGHETTSVKSAALPANNSTAPAVNSTAPGVDHSPLDAEEVAQKKIAVSKPKHLSVQPAQRKMV